MTRLLETAGLSKRFGGVTAIDNLDFALEAGELHCLIGPNGAGKSTFFKLVIGRFPPTSGTILFQGSDVTRLSTAQRVQAGMSMKMQVPGIFPELAVEQNLAIALQRRFDRAGVRTETDRLLGFVGLEHQRRRLAGELSHGHKQWLEIAMAVALRPALLFLDEPTAGLSPEETHRTGEMVLALNRDGMTVLVVEHDMAFVRQIARTVTVLHFGRTFARGTIADIIADEGVQEIYLGKEQPR
ncbi:MAG: ABC transporter ATP-binding protein [Xanthobacteraceae bacterium]|jgi:branched-chain amino acid transport system ATP-binding protein